VGLVFDPYAKKYILTRSGVSSSSSVAFQTFIDSNGNGVYDPGEKTVPGATVDGGVKKAITDSNGRAFIVGGGSGVNSRLQVGLDNIDDPFVKSPPHIITFAPRPGLVVKAPFPLVNASEVILRVVLRESGRTVGLSAVRVRLVVKNKPPIEGSTEFDGSVGFETLGTGIYQVELDPDQAGRLHMRLVAPVQIVVPPTGGLVPDVTAEVIFDRPSNQTDLGAPVEVPDPDRQAAH
jgi:hypothetical protein